MRRFLGRAFPMVADILIFLSGVIGGTALLDIFMTDGQKERLFTAVVVLWDFLDRFKSNRWLSLDDPSELRKFYLRLLSLIIAVLLAVTTGFLWVVFRVYFELYQYSIFY